MAAEFRYVVTDAICRSGVGHIGGVMSLVEIVITLYYRIMKIKPEDPNWPERDRLVLSKGHAGPIVYTALAYQGVLPQGLAHHDQPERHAAAEPHGPDPDPRGRDHRRLARPGALLRLRPGAGRQARRQERTASSASSATARATRARSGRRRSSRPTTGSTTWSSSATTTRCRSTAAPRRSCDLEPLADKWRAFGWETFEINGHDWDAIYDTIGKADAVTGKPAMIIAHTDQGQGQPRDRGPGGLPQRQDPGRDHLPAPHVRRWSASSIFPTEIFSALHGPESQ
ncbi:MAG: hypothetical protein MZU95_02395 [Desulfomicrobium escambiense]|nr:hypothetical protein [Desulfomicrobium escambiense]